MNDYTGTLRISRQTDLQLDFLRKECEKSQTEVLITRDLSTPRVSSLQRQLSRRGSARSRHADRRLLGSPKSSLTENMIKTDWGWWKLLEVLQLMWKSYVKRKTQKKRTTSKIPSFLEVLPEKWQPMTEDWTTEANWLVSLCPWLAGPRRTPPIDQPQLQPDGTQRRAWDDRPKDFGVNIIDDSFFKCYFTWITF